MAKREGDLPFNFERVGWVAAGLLLAMAAGAEAQQPVVKVWRRTETGEAPRWQGATTENTGSI